MSITPTAGRIVHFYDQGHIQPQAAIIAAVHSDRLVNLTVCRATGAVEGRMSVALRQPEDPRPRDAYCEWMPYQVKKDTGSESGEKAAGEEVV